VLALICVAAIAICVGAVAFHVPLSRPADILTRLIPRASRRPCP
jgi:hypothetical protein